LITDKHTTLTDASAEVALLKSRMMMKSYFVMFRRVVDGKKFSPEVLLDHYRWIIQLEKDNLVFASGPLFERDSTQGVGMTIFRTQTHEEAHALGACDPFVLAGAVEFDIKRWQVNEGRIQISVDFSDGGFLIG
jgi:uncharacterized protein